MKNKSTKITYDHKSMQLLGCCGHLLSFVFTRCSNESSTCAKETGPTLPTLFGPWRDFDWFLVDFCCEWNN